jgi:arginine/glutamate-rich protein 1
MAVMMDGVAGCFGDEGIVIRVSYSFASHAVVHPEGLLNEIDRTKHFRTNEENKRLKSEINRIIGTVYTIGAPSEYGGYPNHPNARRVSASAGFEYELFVPLAMILEADGVIYLKDLDLIVGVSELLHEVPHPYSREGQAKRLLDITKRYNEVTTQYYYVDNRGMCGSVWLHDGREVRELIPTADPTLEDGVYRTVTDGGVNPKRNHTVHFREITPDNGFYATKAQAETLGSPDEVMKRREKIEELELKQRLKRLEREELERKIQYEKDKREWELERRDLEDKRRESEYQEKEREREFKERMREKEEELKEKDRQFRLLQMERDQRNARWRQVGEFLKNSKELIAGIIIVSGLVASAIKYLRGRQA